MITYLDHIDHSLFLILNGLHSPFFDGFMLRATQSLVYIPLYLFFLFFVIRKYKWNAWILLLMVFLMILAGDQLSNLVKDSVQRLRPSHQPGLMVHLVEAYKGGMFGFYSAHASNTMSVAVFIGIIFRKKICWLFPIALIWSVWMSYTRVYLGVHYPGDILAGWMAGAALGLIFGNIAIFIISRITPGKNENPRLPQENDERIK